MNAFTQTMTTLAVVDKSFYYKKKAGEGWTFFRFFQNIRKYKFYTYTLCLIFLA